MRSRLFLFLLLVSAPASRSQPAAPRFTSLPPIAFDTTGPVIAAHSEALKPFTVAGERGVLLGQQDGTAVTINPSAAIAGGTGVAATAQNTPHTYTVNRGQVLQFTQDAPLTGTITGAVAFAQAIIADKQFGQCAAQMISSYALGRMIHDNNTCEVQTIQKNGDKGDGKVVTLLRQVATANFMRTRVGGGQ